MSKCHVAFHYESSTQRQTARERTERPALCPSSLWPRARPAPTEDEREREGVVSVCVRGQTFPWQDLRDPAEGRVQPVKERLRARQSISGLHLHNKWSSHGFSSAHTRAHMSVSTQRSSAHADARSERGGGRKRKRE